jgi:starvation-inducible outer membrane lipoprotein
VKITALLVTALLIALSGCAGTPEPSKENTVLSVKAQAEAVSAAEKETEQRKVIKIPVLVSETRYLRNNQVDTKVINIYEDGTDRLLESVTYDKTGETVETAVTTYSGNESGNSVP